VQAFFSVLFLYDLLQSLFRFRTEPLSWETHEALELAGVLGLVLGFVLGIIALRRLRREFSDVNSKLRVASQGFFDLVQDEFTSWQLSPSERDIAMYILKGLSNAEIAEVTGKKQGTIKAQCNAVFRKTGLSNRSQFTSYFIEILMQEPLNDRKKAAE
jgi:DNA-binding CsgD family transcriptional regulator